MAPYRDRSGKRLFVLLFFIFLSLVGIAARLIFVQQVQAKKYQAMAVEQRLREIKLNGERGVIYDRNGGALAVNLDACSIYATPYFIKNPHQIAQKLSVILGIDVSILEKKLREKSGFVYLARQVDRGKSNKIRELKIDGLGFIKERKRFYPGGNLASHILGFVGIDNQGLGGVEFQYDKTLSGQPGKLIVEGDPAGSPIPGGIFSKVAPTEGQPVYLTIDKDIQYKAQVELYNVVKEYEAKGGSVIVMNPVNGEIYALANTPSFDPNNFGKANEAEMRNRAITDVFEPGSTAKILTISASLEEGVVSPDDVFNLPAEIEVGGGTFGEYDGKAKGDLTVTGIVAESSNVGAIKIAQKLGEERLYKYLRAFGLGRVSGIDFPGEGEGYVPALEEWSATSIATIPYGQGISTTALQMLRVVASVANDGVMVRPHLTRVSARPTASTKKRVISEKTAHQMQSILIEAVEKGTGKNARITGYEVGGKTGTAQKPREDRGGYDKGRLVVSFAGFVSNNDPQLAIIVTIDEPQPTGRLPIYGATLAAPVFKNVAEFSIKRLKIPPGSRVQ
jgi:stage V sporulation protein D (sporulation-specific penicillin-binding protein)